MLAMLLRVIERVLEPILIALGDRLVEFVTAKLSVPATA